MLEKYYNKFSFYYNYNPDLENQINYIEKIDAKCLEEYYYDDELLKTKIDLNELSSNEDKFKKISIYNESILHNNNENILSQNSKKNDINAFENKDLNKNDIDLNIYNNFLNLKLNRKSNDILDAKNIKIFLFSRISILTFINISADKEMNNIDFEMNDFPNKITDNYCIESLLKKFKLIEKIDEIINKFHKKIHKIKQRLFNLSFESEENLSNAEFNKECIKDFSGILIEILWQIFNIHKNIKHNKIRFIKFNSKQILKNYFYELIKILPFKDSKEIQSLLNFFLNKYSFNNNYRTKCNSSHIFRKTIFHLTENNSFTDFGNLIKKTNMNKYNHDTLLEHLRNIISNSQSLNKFHKKFPFQIESKNNLSDKHLTIFNNNSLILDNKKCVKSTYKVAFSDLVFNLFINMPRRKRQNINNTSLFHTNHNIKVDYSHGNTNSSLLNKYLKKVETRKKNKILNYDFVENNLFSCINKNKKNLKKDKNYILSLAYRYHDNYQDVLSSIKNINSNKIKENIFNLEKKMKNNHLLDFSKDFYAKRYFDSLIKTKKDKLRKLREFIKHERLKDNYGYYNNYNININLKTEIVEEIKQIIVSYEDEKTDEYLNLKNDNFFSGNNIYLQSNLLNTFNNKEKDLKQKELFINRSLTKQDKYPLIPLNGTLDIDRNRRKSTAAECKENNRYNFNYSNRFNDNTNEYFSDKKIKNDELDCPVLNNTNNNIILIDNIVNKNNILDKKINITDEISSKTKKIIIIEEKLKNNREKNLKTLEFLSKKPNPHKNIFQNIKTKEARGRSIYSSNYNNNLERNIFENNHINYMDINNNYKSENEKELYYDYEKDDINFLNCKYQTNNEYISLDKIKNEKISNNKIFINELISQENNLNNVEFIQNTNLNSSYIDKNINKTKISKHLEEDLDYSNSYSVNINNKTINNYFSNIKRNSSNNNKENSIIDKSHSNSKINIPKLNLNLTYADESKIDILNINSEKNRFNEKNFDIDNIFMDNNQEPIEENDYENNDENKEEYEENEFYSDLDEIEQIYNKYNDDLRNIKSERSENSESNSINNKFYEEN